MTSSQKRPNPAAAEQNNNSVDSALPPLVIVAGLSGAGKSTVLNAFEDMHYITMDGLPPQLIPEIISVIPSREQGKHNGLVLGINLLEENSVTEFITALEYMKQAIVPLPAISIVFIEARTAMLTQRYATTRRPHPLEADGLGLSQALAEERRRLERVREMADLVIDTTTYSIHDLRRTVQQKWTMLKGKKHALCLHFISFGFKYGIPTEADMLFDLRFLPNPYFQPDLRPLSGKDRVVSDFVLQSEPGASFSTKLLDFLEYLLPLYEAEGRYRITVGIGCTGGRHRSVAVTEYLAAAFTTSEYALSIEHRHLELG